MKRTLGRCAAAGIAVLALAACSEGPAHLDSTLAPPSRIDVAFDNLPTGTPTKCMEDVVQQIDGTNAVPLNCTANDLNLFFTIPGQGQALPLCLPGQVLDPIEVEAHFGANAASRWDIGLWIRSDGGNAPNALRGDCRHWSLTPVGTEGDASAPGGIRLSPFYNEDGDTCGDLDQGFETVLTGVILTGLVCRDFDGDGLLDVGACVGYDNNGNQDHSCTDPAAAVGQTRPNTKAKCSCGPLDLPVNIAGKVIIKKLTVPAGDPQDFDFTSPTTGLSGTLSHNETYEALLMAGNYSVTEVVPAGWDLTNITCVDPTSNSSGTLGTATASINLAAGETVTCTFTNTKRGTIEIEKQTVPGGVTESFGFTDNIAAPNAFNLQDDGVKTFTNVLPGSYSVVEGAEADFNLTNIQCNDGNSTGNTGTRTASISLQPGETVRCVFTNTIKAGTVIIKKETDPDGASGSFTFTQNVDASGNFSLSDNGMKTFSNVQPGQYTVAENDPTPAFDLTNLVCDDANSTENIAGRTATINVEPDETVTCTFTNRQRGTVIIKKETDPDGASGSFTFTQNVDASGNFSLSDNGMKTFSNVVPGQYSVAENDPTPGFDLTNLVCDDANSTENIAGRTATINVEAGETVTCTYTNRQRGTVIIKKETNPDGATGSFTFTQNVDASGNFSLSDNGMKTFSNVVPGQYSVAENDPTPGFDLTNLVCDDANSTENIAGRTATINVEAGETVTCTYTNTQRGSIIITKDAQPDDAEDFSFTSTSNQTTTISPFSLDDDADGTLPASRTFDNLKPGSYTVTEGAETEWDLTALSCTDPSGGTSLSLGTRTVSIGLAAGETVSCTFTNRRKAKLIVQKQIVGGGTQLFDFSRNPGGVSFTLTHGGSNDSGFSLTPGTYRVCELNLAVSWAATATLDGNPATLINPNDADTPPQDLGNRCVDVPLAYGDIRTVVWTNRPPPGGDARTIGYWKNWSSCSGGNQYQKATERGILDKTLDGNLPQTIGVLVVDTCQEGVNILDKSNLSGRKMASDAAYNLAAQLLAAKLNYSAGALQCQAATDAINAGQALLAGIGFDGTGNYLRPKDGALYTQANNLAATLDAYNNNDLCPAGP